MLRFTIVFVRFAFLTVLLAALAIGLPGSQPGDAAFPGANGKITWTRFNGNHEIYVMNADGSGPTNLTNHPSTDAGSHWSPDGTKITFYSTRDGDSEVYVMNADGSGLTNVTNNSLGDSPSGWSPDGTKILFSSDRDGTVDIYRMKADGTDVIQLTNSSPGYNAAAQWSPDGTKIAFESSRDGNGEVYVMNANGSSQTNITNHPAHDGSPDWSPDGTKIAFNTYRDNPTLTELYVMNADGTGVTRCTNTPGVNEAFPAWSPDGTKIAYSRVIPGSGTENEIYVMNGCGGGATNLTPHPNSATNDFEPDWQPDADSDGVLPPDDVCPLGPGPAANAGCGPPGPPAVGGIVGVEDAQPDPAPAGGSERKAIDYAPLAAAAVAFMAACIGSIVFWRRRQQL